MGVVIEGLPHLWATWLEALGETEAHSEGSERSSMNGLLV